MRSGLIVVLALVAIGCDVTGPKEDLTGHWIARSIGHATQVGFTLMQSGDAITGKACAISEGILLYKDAPVFGAYPELQFTVAPAQTQPCCGHLAGTRFTGRHDDTRDIVGSYGTIDLRFERAITALCN